MSSVTGRPLTCPNRQPTPASLRMCQRMCSSIQPEVCDAPIDRLTRSQSDSLIIRSPSPGRRSNVSKTPAARRKTARESGRDLGHTDTKPAGRVPHRRGGTVVRTRDRCCAQPGRLRAQRDRSEGVRSCKGDPVVGPPVRDVFCPRAKGPQSWPRDRRAVRTPHFGCIDGRLGAGLHRSSAHPHRPHRGPHTDGLQGTSTCRSPPCSSPD